MENRSRETVKANLVWQGNEKEMERENYLRNMNQRDRNNFKRHKKEKHISLSKRNGKQRDS